MRLTSALMATFLGMTLLGNGMPDPARVNQARANYQALVRGDRQLSQLSRQELADIVALDQALRHRDERSPSQRCVDAEVRRAGGSPSYLARQVIDLKCREPGTGVN